MLISKKRFMRHLTTLPLSFWFLCQVLRSLTVAEAQQSGRGEGGGKSGPQTTLLLQSLKQAAFYSPLDPIAGHFLRPVLTEAFQVNLARYITHFDNVEILE